MMIDAIVEYSDDFLLSKPERERDRYKAILAGVFCAKVVIFVHTLGNPHEERIESTIKRCFDDYFYDSEDYFNALRDANYKPRGPRMYVARKSVSTEYPPATTTTASQLRLLSRLVDLVAAA